MQGGILGGAGGMVKGALGFAGVFGFAQMVQETKSFEAALTDIQITGQKSSAWLKGFRKQVLDVSDATGKSKAEVAGFVAAVTTQTGNVKLGTDVLADMAKTSVATGASMEDLASVFIKMSTAMNVTGKEAKQAFNILRGGELKGSFRLQDVAAQIGGVGASAAATLGGGAQGLQGVRGLSALFQLTARGVGADQPQDVKTALTTFIAQIGAKRGDIEKGLGVSLKGPGGEFKSLPELVRIMAKGLASERGKTLLETKGRQVFGRAGIKTAQQLRLAGLQGLDADTAQAASVNTLLAAGSGGDDMIGRQFKQRMESPAQKFQVAMNKMGNALQRQMLPVLVAATKVLPKLAKALKFVLDHSETILKLWLGLLVLAVGTVGQVEVIAVVLVSILISMLVLLALGFLATGALGGVRELGSSLALRLPWPAISLPWA
jgi:TP901 family phage tail tape measure protein